jgi:hypothetical protein
MTYFIDYQIIRKTLSAVVDFFEKNVLPSQNLSIFTNRILHC